MNYVGHLAFGVNAYKHLKDYINDRDVFLTACVAPDIANTDKLSKAETHYRNLSNSLYKCPDIKRFLIRYSERITEDFVIGYLCHLFGDMAFSSAFLPSIAKPLDENYRACNTKDAKFVKILKSNSIIPVSVFLSEIGIYDDYTKTNIALARIFEVPNNIKFSEKDPKMSEIDKNKLSLIKDEVGKYLGKYPAKPIIKGDTLAIDIEEYSEFIEKYSHEFCIMYIRYIQDYNYSKIIKQ